MNTENILGTVYLDYDRCERLKLPYYTKGDEQPFKIEVSKLIAAYSVNCDDAHRKILSDILEAGTPEVMMSIDELPGWFHISPC